MLKTKPNLTIIIPFLNRKQLFKNTLESISNQKDVEHVTNLVLVDNGSTDGATEMAKEWIENRCPKWVKPILIEEKRKAPSIARNRGLQMCETEWVMFFDSDDLMRPEHIANVQKAIRIHQHADLIHWSVTFEGRNAHHIKRAKLQGIEIDLVMHGVWSTQRYVVKRKFLKQSGNWNENVIAWDDWELSLRLFLNKPKYISLPGMNTVKVISHDDSISGPNFTHKEGLWEKTLAEGVKAALELEGNEILFLIIAKAAVLAATYRTEGNIEASDRLIGFIKENAPNVYPYAMFCYYWRLKMKRGSSIMLPFIMKRAVKKMNRIKKNTSQDI